MSKYLIENLFGIEGWNIAWYGVIIACGMLLGLALAVYRAKKENIHSDVLYDFLLIAAPIAILCVRAYYVIFEWETYTDNPVKVFAIWEGGLAIYGGVIGGVITALVFCRINKLSFLQFADLLLPSLVLGQSIGRWGNFMNQEAYGNLVTNPNLQFFPYAVYIEASGNWHQATFFYESFSNAILLVVMLLCYPRFKRQGYLIPMYMIGYGAIRFVVEGLRTDSLYIIPGLRVSQLLSLILVVCGCILAIIMRHKAPTKKSTLWE